MSPVSQATEARQRIFTVGLTGGIGSGKSTVADSFAEHGICIVDADEVSHRLTAPGGAAMPAIRAGFGAAMQDSSGALNRAAMRQLVFTDSAARTRLEAILHPMIRTECTRLLGLANSPYAMLVVPLLLDSHAWRTHCDRILVVDCPPELQIKRVMERSGLSEEDARRIMAAQVSRETRLAAASEVIDNSGTLPALQARVEALHQHYLLESAKPPGNS
ncbi:dephospho-CoA kinase [Uliginosibacterium sp. 31-16]|uniref:dephospho-CoA kinase n=1 Tax=Uliginosibacterium sp. 31-16 TaxID=3068315 RepID=UPI00273E451A|nr:dephospho-CoA kinase [Uliginosibacterium sp. 31-16]MDP5241132.1 dephospho-CoA kinase [Uliginosibacterium sp. 31-16]